MYLHKEWYTNNRFRLKPTTYQMYKISVSECIFPEKCKLAIIKHLYKNHNRSSTNNHRTIPMINSFAKILEKIIKNTLIQYLENDKLLMLEPVWFQI